MSRNKFLAIIFLVFIFLAIVAVTGYFGYYHHVHQYDVMIVRIASRYDLDPLLVRSVIYEESYFKKDARSSAGAIGLMQVTPIIVKEWTRVTSQQNLNKAFPSPSENRRGKYLTEEELLTSPEINLQLGCWYLDQLMKRYNEVEDPLLIVLASYNAGPSNAQRWQQLTYQTAKKATKDSFRERYIRQIDFPETKRYVSSILARYKNSNQELGQTDRVTSIFSEN
jgi:soluble lytic murein transglycosylase